MIGIAGKGHEAAADERDLSVSAPSALPVEFGAATDPGRVRDHNEDSLVAAPPVFAVADGMGGHDCGEFASGETVAALFELSKLDWVTEEELLAAIDEAQHKVRAITSSSSRAAGTTVSGVVLTADLGEPSWLVFNLGDSRTYRYAGERLERLTRDHSEVQELLDAGRITAQEAAKYPRRNVLTRAVGIGAHTGPESHFEPVGSNDVILICSDGLTNELDDTDIAQVLATGRAPQELADELVAQALRAGGRDNVSVVIVRASGSTGPDGGDVEAIVGKTTAPTTRHQDE